MYVCIWEAEEKRRKKKEERKKKKKWKGKKKGRKKERVKAHGSVGVQQLYKCTSVWGLVILNLKINEMPEVYVDTVGFKVS